MKKIKTLILAGVGICFLSSLLPAQPRGRNFDQRGMRNDRSGNILFHLKARREALQLTDEQLEKIENLSLKMEELRVEHQNQNNVLRLEMKKLKSDMENPDYDKIKAVMSKLSDSRNEMIIQRMKQRAEFLNILTPEQKKMMKAQGQQRMDGRRAPLRRMDERRFPRLRRGLRR